MVEHRIPLGGNIRTFPEDFIVEEIWQNYLCQIKDTFLTHIKDYVKWRLQQEQAYVHCTLVKKNWETIRALNYLRRKLRYSLKRFGLSGMKDKRAISAQRISIWKGKIETLQHLQLPDMYLKDYAYSKERITLGSAIGNRFTITIRDIRKTYSEIKEILTFFQTICTSQGILNYFGPQRFGKGNVEGGKAIIDGDLQRAVEVILKKVRAQFDQSGIESISNVFWYEKTMLQHLVKYPKDYAGALRKIPKRILRIYPHAYQSHIFNQQLTHAIWENQVPKTITVPGFQIPKMPELNMREITRASFIKPTHFHILKIQDESTTIRFSLKKGEYASTVLLYLMSDTPFDANNNMKNNSSM
jgi:tRNA pseudouridine13 synthase